MGFRQGAFARIWSINASDNFSTANITVSRRNKDDETKYDVVFKDGYTRFIGEAHKKLSGVSVGEGGMSIKILSCDVENRYDAEKKKLYTNFIVYDFEFPDGNGEKSGGSAKPQQKATKPAPAPAASESEEDELPF